MLAKRNTQKHLNILLYYACFLNVLILSHHVYIFENSTKQLLPLYHFLSCERECEPMTCLFSLPSLSFSHFPLLVSLSLQSAACCIQFTHSSSARTANCAERSVRRDNHSEACGLTSTGPQCYWELSF